MNPSMCAFALAAATFLAADPALAEDKRAKTFSGIASYYDKHYSGRTARGDTYDATKFTAAHRTLPFGTRLRVTGPNQRSVVVEVNDRGPFIKSRVLDLSYAAATELRMIGRGLVHVTAQVEEPSVTSASDRAPR